MLHLHPPPLHREIVVVVILMEALLDRQVLIQGRVAEPVLLPDSQDSNVICLAASARVPLMRNVLLQEKEISVI
jgi:hypothetical protein